MQNFILIELPRGLWLGRPPEVIVPVLESLWQLALLYAGAWHLCGYALTVFLIVQLMLGFTIGRKVLGILLSWFLVSSSTLSTSLSPGSSPPLRLPLQLPSFFVFFVDDGFFHYFVMDTGVATTSVLRRL